MNSLPLIQGRVASFIGSNAINQLSAPLTKQCGSYINSTGLADGFAEGIVHLVFCTEDLRLLLRD